MSHIVIENTSEEGVFSTHALNCDILEDEENKLHFAASGSNGEVLSEDQTIEGDYTLLAGELDLAGHTLTVRGNFIHAGGKVNVNGGSLIVEGDYKSSISMKGWRADNRAEYGTAADAAGAGLCAHKGKLY